MILYVVASVINWIGLAAMNIKNFKPPVLLDGTEIEDVLKEYRKKFHDFMQLRDAEDWRVMIGEFIDMKSDIGAYVELYSTYDEYDQS